MWKYLYRVWCLHKTLHPAQNGKWKKFRISPQHRVVLKQILMISSLVSSFPIRTNKHASATTQRQHECETCATELHKHNPSSFALRNLFAALRRAVYKTDTHAHTESQPTQPPSQQRHPSAMPAMISLIGNPRDETRREWRARADGCRCVAPLRNNSFSPSSERHREMISHQRHPFYTAASAHRSGDQCGARVVKVRITSIRIDKRRLCVWGGFVGVAHTYVTRVTLVPPSALIV